MLFSFRELDYTESARKVPEARRYLVSKAVSADSPAMGARGKHPFFHVAWSTLCEEARARLFSTLFGAV